MRICASVGVFAVVGLALATGATSAEAEGRVDSPIGFEPDRKRPRGAAGGERPLIRLFGTLEIEDGDRRLGPAELGGARPKQVLEILLSARGHRVPTDRIADLLWGEQRPKHAAASIQTFVSVLRRHLVADRDRARQLVITEPEAYRFATDLVELDLDRFDALLERSSREPTRRARRSLELALALVRGQVLEDEPYALWAHDLRGSYEGRVLGAHLEAADAALAEHDFSDAFVHSEAAVVLDRFSERAHRAAMLALYALGRQHDALARYRTLRTALAEELGLEPTPETRALEAAILRQEDVHSLLPRPITPGDGDASEPSVRLLGRKHELEMLERVAQRALDGSFALVQLEGDAGLGKTRMLDEMAAFFAGARVGRARCSPLEKHLPYVPLAATLRDAGLELDAERLPALGRILPELALTQPARKYSEVEALEALVQVVSEQAPVLLLLDDLHFADQETIAAVDYLQHRCVGIPGGIVTTVRTVCAPPDHPLRRLRPSAQVRLCPLTAEEIAPLGIPGLFEATGGNPRFITNTVANGRQVELPSALSETLLTQLRAEGRRGYRILLAASLLPPPFEPEPLAAMLELEVAELTEQLERLCERRILRVDGNGFRFRYDLVRAVLYYSLSPARRRILGERLALTDAQLPLLPMRVLR
jgi:DNA-binding SARP family transcriptional activator